MQSHPEIDDLKRQFADAATRYSRVCRQIGPNEKTLDDFKDQVNQLMTMKEAYKADLDGYNRRIRKCNNGGKVKKARSKEPRRDIALKLYKEVSEKLKVINEQQERSRKMLRRDKLLYNYDESKQHYYSVRHALMLAILAVENDDEGLRDYKARIIQSLIAHQCVSEEMPPDQVLYYEKDDKIHAFYGGRRFGSTLQSPDGVGHGHAILDATTLTTDGFFEFESKRPPK